MKKIAILTLNGYFNYGNRLQNFAAQEVLKSLGYSVETVINTTDYNNKNSKETGVIRKIQKVKTMSYKDFYMKINNKIFNLVNKNKIGHLNNKREEVFKDFTLSYIEETDYSISENNIPDNFSSRYNYFVTGSDQVWNPVFRHGSSIDFLTFAPKNKRIAFAPSFGISEIPKEYMEDYREWLLEMNSLSIRENAGAKIIKNLTGREATVLVDPTLMLSKEKWLSIATTPSNKPKKKYLLTYFLGSLSKEKNKMIKSIAQKHKLEIINLAQIKDEVTYCTGPCEFIDYINSSSVFCTDSFHGAAFSILLETPFIVFNRSGSLPSMNSRLDTLLNKFRLESRLDKNIKFNEQIFNVDYSHVNAILEAERKRTFDYLKKALV
jgi:Polysaccharide pyruvyl transferase